MGRKRTYEPEQVLVALERWMLAHRRAPTIEELRKSLGVGSGRTVLRYLDELETGKFIRRLPGSRGVQLLRSPKAGLQTQPVPVLGTIAAGSLDLAERHYDGWLQLPIEDLKPKSARFFLLRVRGRSMDRATVAGEKIEPDDLILVREQSTAEPGKVVVAQVDGTATVKRLARLPGYWVLKPESSESQHRPILVGPEFSIQGEVVKVIKKGALVLDGDTETDN
jgi:repressor LexA